MIKYDRTFQMTNKMEVVFDAIEEEKGRWIKENSVLINYIYIVLQSRDIMKKNMMVGR